MSIPARTSIILTTTALIALVLLLVSLARVLERGENAVTAAHIRFILADLDQTIERNLSIGLPLNNLQPIERALEQAVASNKSLLALEVFSPTGIALYSTDRGAVGERIPEEWQHAIDDRVGDRPWQVHHLNTLVIGTSIENDFDQVAGWLALIMEDTVLARPGGQFFFVLADSWPYLLAALVIVLLLGLALGIDLRLRIRRIVQRVESESEQPVARGPLMRPLPRLIQVTHRAERTVDDVVATLRQIDSEI